MVPENIQGIQQRLHELNAEEARLLANIQVSLAGIERIHAQRRIEELTLVELQGKVQDSRREREDMKPQQKKKKKGKQAKQGQQGQPGPGNQSKKKRGAEEQPERPKYAKRQRQGGQSNASGGQNDQDITAPIPSSSNPGIWNQRQNHALPGRECKCSRVDVHCGGNESTCQVCKALGCASITQSHYLNSEHQGNVPTIASPAVPTWPHVGRSIINIDTDVMDLQG